MIRSVMFVVLLACSLAASSSSARAEPAQPVYAIAIGNNAPPDEQPKLPVLRFADDDAVRYHDVLRRAAVRAELLARLDATSQARHPRAVTYAREPSWQVLSGLLAELSIAMRADLNAGREPVLFLTYSGHGGTLPDGEPYLALADGPLTRSRLHAQVIEALPPVRIHLIVDACNAAAATGARGPGAETPREIEINPVAIAPEQAAKLLEQNSLARYPNVGALTASAADQEAYEWERIEGGVFTHQVISALLGAADVNADRQIAYSEAQAFVAAAGRNVDHARARPSVVAHPPSGDLRAVLLSLDQLRDIVLLEGRAPRLGRFYVERADGTRWLEANLAPGLPVALALPASESLYVRSDDQEASVRGVPGSRVRFESLDFGSQRIAARGSVDDALQTGLFGASFGREYYLGYVDSEGLISVSFDARSEQRDHVEGDRAPLKTWAIVSWSAGGAALIACGLTAALAVSAKSDFDDEEFPRPAERAAERYDDFRAAALVTGAAALILGGAGTGLWFYADGEDAALGARGHF
jgi:hypothetical protein